MIASVGGPVTAGLRLPDGSLLAAQSGRLLRLDPASGQVLQSADAGHGAILDWVEVSPYLIALTEDGLMSFQYTDALPQPVGFTPGGGQALAAQRSLVLVAARQAGLRVFSVTADGSIPWLASLPLPGEALDVAFSPDGRSAYVAGGDAGLLRIDLTDPAHPLLSGALSSITPVESVAVMGDRVLAGNQGRMWALDPHSANPILGLYAPLRQGRRIAIEGDYAYIADAAEGLKILWLADPLAPLQTFGEFGQSASAVLVKGDTVYLAGAGGVRIFDVSNRFQPVQTARLDLPGQPQALALSGDRLFVALGEAGIAAIDLPTLQIVSLIPLKGAALDVLVVESTLYAAAGQAGLVTLDIANPDAATILSTLILPGAATSLARRADGLYVAAGESGLIGLDITRRSQPLIASALPPEPGHSVEAVVISGKRAFVAQGDVWVIADVSRVDHIGRLGMVESPASHFASAGAVLYALDGNLLHLYDIGATAEPIVQGGYAGMSSIADSSVANSIALLAGAAGAQIAAVDFSNPAFPYEVGSIGQQGGALHAIAQGENVTLAGGMNGLSTFSLTQSGGLIPRQVLLRGAEMTRLAAGDGILISAGQAGWRRHAPDLFPLPDAGSGQPIAALAFDGKRLALASGQTVTLYYLTPAGDPSMIGQFSAPAPVNGLAFADNALIIADMQGVGVAQIEPPGALLHVRTPAPAVSVTSHAGDVYAALSDGSLALITLRPSERAVQISASLPVSRVAALIPSNSPGLIYALSESAVTLIDTSQPDRPVPGASSPLPAAADQAALVGGTLAILTSGEAVRLYPPTITGDSLLPLKRIPTSAQAVAFGWPISIAALGDGGLALLDLSTGVQSPPFSAESAYGLWLEGDRLFSVGNSLILWDLSDPAAPRQLAALPLSTPGAHITPGPDGLLLVSTLSGVTIVRHQGDTLTQVADQPLPESVDRALWQGDVGLLAAHGGDLMVVDLSDPSAPFLLMSLGSPSGQFVSDLLALDDQHVLASREGGLDALRLTAPAEVKLPALAGVLPGAASQATGIALEGDRLALALGSAGVALMSVGDPQKPALLSTPDTPGEALAVALDGDTLYVADGACGLRVFDAHDPAHPLESGYWRGFAGDVALMRDDQNRTLAVVAGGDQIVRLRYDPSLPPVPPPVPHDPAPADLQAGLPTELTLAWQPPVDPCDPLSYEVYLGQLEPLPLLSRGGTDPALSTSDLAGASTYAWRVSATDRQGDRIEGPTWRFATDPAKQVSDLPPSPPLFLRWIEENPTTSMLLAAALLGLPLLVWLRRRTKNEG
jgi:hypothetical protein